MHALRGEQRPRAAGASGVQLHAGRVAARHGHGGQHQRADGDLIDGRQRRHRGVVAQRLQLQQRTGARGVSGFAEVVEPRHLYAGGAHVGGVGCEHAESRVLRTLLSMGNGVHCLLGAPKNSAKQRASKYL